MASSELGIMKPNAAARGFICFVLSSVACLHQRATQAITVRCNAYSFGRAALLGDAAHSTGGLSLLPDSSKLFIYSLIN